MQVLEGKTQDEPNLEVRQPSPKVWWICVLLFLATAIVYLDRQVLALTAQKIIAEFHLSNEQFGHVVAAFRASYGIVQIVGGFLVDRFGPFVMFPAASAAWSAVGMLTAFASSASMLIGFRFMLGASEALNWPCALKVTNKLLPPKDRALGNGIFNSGGAVGALIAPVIVTLIAIHWSWRAAFVVTGAFGAAWIALWLWTTRDLSALLKGTEVSFREVLLVAGRLVAMRQFWILAISALFVNGVNYYLTDWIPLYLQTYRGFSFSKGNALSIVIYGGTFSGNILAGLFIKTLVRYGWNLRSARNLALLIACLLMFCATLAGITQHRYIAVAYLALTGLGVGAFLVIYLTLVQELNPKFVGISSGLLGGFSNIAYGALNGYIGRLADRHSTGNVLLAIGLLPWLAFTAILLGETRES